MFTKQLSAYVPTSPRFESKKTSAFPEKGGTRSGFILASGCEVLLNSTEDRIDHFFKYVHAADRHAMFNLKKQHPELFPG